MSAPISWQDLSSRIGLDETVRFIEAAGGLRQEGTGRPKSAKTWIEILTKSRNSAASPV
jgi:hypothetical protein